MSGARAALGGGVTCGPAEPEACRCCAFNDWHVTKTPQTSDLQVSVSRSDLIPFGGFFSCWGAVSRHLGRNELLPMETNSDLIAQPFFIHPSSCDDFGVKVSGNLSIIPVCVLGFLAAWVKGVYPRLFLDLSLQLHFRVTQQDDFPDLLLTLFQVWGKFCALVELLAPSRGSPSRPARAHSISVWNSSPPVIFCPYVNY